MFWDYRCTLSRRKNDLVRDLWIGILIVLLSQ